MLRVELGKAVRRWRTWVMAALLASVPALIVLALALNPPPPGVDGGFFTLALRNGLFAPLAALVLVQVFLLPLTAALLTGDAIAGEAAGGTLRYLLVRPVRRSTFVLGKYAAVVALLVAAVAVIVVVGLAAGGAAFGIRPAPSLSGTTLSVPEALLRIAGAGAYSVAGAAALGAVGLFISSLTESGPGATVATVAVVVVGLILGQLSSLEFLHPYLLTEYGAAFVELFRSPVAYRGIVRGLSVYAGYTVVFLGLALAVVTRRDVHS